MQASIMLICMMMQHCSLFHDNLGGLAGNWKWNMGKTRWDRAWQNRKQKHRAVSNHSVWDCLAIKLWVVDSLCVNLHKHELNTGHGREA